MATSYEQLKTLAREKRAQYGVVTAELGLQKVRSIYRAEGITLDYRATSPKIRAVYMCDDDDPSVMVNNKLPAEPKLFSLVHELKHHYVDRPIIESGQIKCGAYNENQVIEIGAEVFAAEFIYPEAEFLLCAERLGLHAGQVNANDVVLLKRGCGAKVSYMFLRKRLERFNFITPGEFLKVKFQNLEEELFGPPIYKQDWFRERRAARTNRPAGPRKLLR